MHFVLCLISALQIRVSFYYYLNCEHCKLVETRRHTSTQTESVRAARFNTIPPYSELLNINHVSVFCTGQTGRYILILKLRGGERQLVADDCPLQRLAQLGQLATEVQFILRRTGPSLSDASDTPTTERPEAEPLKRKESHKTVTFSQRSSKHSKRTKPNRTSSPRASPEPQASPVSFLDPVNPVNAIPSKEEVFRQILQQQMRLEDLEIQLQALERETGLWEQESSSAIVPVLWSLQGELEELEQQQRQNEAELMQQERWEEELQAEVDREQGTYSKLSHFLHLASNFFLSHF